MRDVDNLSDGSRDQDSLGETEAGTSQSPSCGYGGYLAADGDVAHCSWPVDGCNFSPASKPAVEFSILGKTQPDGWPVQPPHVADANACADEGWYGTSGKAITLCPITCARIREKIRAGEMVAVDFANCLCGVSPCSCEGWSPASSPARQPSP